MLHTVFITLASNIRQMENISLALDKLQKLPIEQVSVSTISYYKPINFPYKSDDFANCVVRFVTKLNSSTLIELCHEIENNLGRNLKVKREAPEKISIDIDIIIYDDEIIRRKDYERQYFIDGFKEILKNINL